MSRLRNKRVLVWFSAAFICGALCAAGLAFAGSIPGLGQGKPGPSTTYYAANGDASATRPEGSPLPDPKELDALVAGARRWERVATNEDDPAKIEVVSIQNEALAEKFPFGYQPAKDTPLWLVVTTARHKFICGICSWIDNEHPVQGIVGTREVATATGETVDYGGGINGSAIDISQLGPFVRVVFPG
jgi:hypothetical protein